MYLCVKNVEQKLNLLISLHHLLVLEYDGRCIWFLIFPIVTYPIQKKRKNLYKDFLYNYPGSTRNSLVRGRWIHSFTALGNNDLWWTPGYCTTSLCRTVSSSFPGVWVRRAQDAHAYSMTGLTSWSDDYPFSSRSSERTICSDKSQLGGSRTGDRPVVNREARVIFLVHTNIICCLEFWHWNGKSLFSHTQVGKNCWFAFFCW